MRLVAGVDGELRQLLAMQVRQLGGKGLAVLFQVSLDRPVFARREFLDFFFALHNHAQRRALHASRRQAAAHLLPQQWRQVEAHQVVERAPCLLGVDQVGRQLARVLDGFVDGALGDLVKHHAVDALVLERLPVFQ